MPRKRVIIELRTKAGTRAADSLRMASDLAVKGLTIDKL